MNDYFYVTPIQAEKLKCLNYPFFSFNYNDSLFHYYGGFPNIKGDIKNTFRLLPKLEDVARWLRDEKKMDVIVNRKYLFFTKSKYYDCDIFQDDVDEIEIEAVYCKKYEDALRYGIDRAIEILT